jgi:hypothetical protein
VWVWCCLDCALQALVPDPPAQLLRFADILNRAVHGAKLVQQKVERVGSLLV